jgi:FMN reductase
MSEREPVNDRGPSERGHLRLVLLSAGTGSPSSTRMLGDRIAQKALDLLREADAPATVSVIELGPLAVDIARATVSGVPSAELQAAIEQVAAADALIAATPVYKAGISGLFKSFVDFLDNDLLVAKPVLLAATAGSARHALVPDEQMRPLFAYMRALTLPTSVFATPEDWGVVELGERIERAAGELSVLLRAGAGREIADRGWSSYQHEFAGNATRAGAAGSDLDFDSPPDAPRHRRLLRHRRARGADRSLVGLRVRVAGDGEGDQHRHVEGVDDEGESDDDQRSAGEAVAEEGVLDQAGGDRVGEQGPGADLEEAVPGEVVDPGEREEVGRQEEGGEAEEDDRRGQRHRFGEVGGEVDAAGDDQAERGHPDLGDRRHRALRRHFGLHQPLAILVMITRVAICRAPRMPAV